MGAAIHDILIDFKVNVKLMSGNLLQADADPRQPCIRAMAG
jgi:hypothetical protein